MGQEEKEKNLESYLKNSVHSLWCPKNLVLKPEIKIVRMVTVGATDDEPQPIIVLFLQIYIIAAHARIRCLPWLSQV